jgi:sugar lactone lactonase YvrE
MAEISRVGDFSLGWGESLVWDDRAARLYLVDCAARTLHWLEGGEPPLETMAMPGLPVGTVLAADGRLVMALDDGFYVVDVAAGTTELLTEYPEGLGGRANDAATDPNGNLVTGTLNLTPGPGSYWWYSTSDGWRQLDEGIGNANGPVVLEVDDQQTLVFADTQASKLYAYDYDGVAGTVGERRVFADTTTLGGMPDGACADVDNAVWGCVLGPGKIVRYTPDGVDRVIEAGVELPSDVTFGGKDLDRLYFVSIAAMAGFESTSPNAGALMVVDGLGTRGRPESRFLL